MNGKGLILIVEDQLGFRRIYEDVLASDGYQVLVAEDGEKGWELAQEKKPDLVLLDLGLPKIDGFEVLRRMRANKITQNIPVVIFSVMGEEKDIKKALEMGANDYTVKGFYTPRQILSKIKGLVSSEPTQNTQSTYKVGIKEESKDALRLKDEIGLTKGYRCPQCGGEIVLELFPDYVREGGHWFISRLTCPPCGKVF
jgi:DNA-binding response OmpR family regulator